MVPERGLYPSHYRMARLVRHSLDTKGVLKGWSLSAVSIRLRLAGHGWRGIIDASRIPIQQRCPGELSWAKEFGSTQ